MEKLYISVTKEVFYDALVLGGGVAGCAAAIAAGRKGVKVMLLEQSGVLGGQATLGIVTPLDSKKDKTGRSFGGILEEVTQQLNELGSYYCSGGANEGVSPVASPHILKYILLKKCLDSKVDVYFHASLLSVEKKDKDIRAIFALTKNGIIKIHAKVFIDASGDGDLIEKSGAPYSLGCEEDSFAGLEESGLDKSHFSDKKAENYGDKKLMQPVSLFFTLGGVDMSKALKYNNVDFKIGDLGITRQRLSDWKFYNTPGFEEKGDALPLPQGRILVTRSPRPDVAVVNMSRIVNINGADADSLNEGEIKAQMQLIAIVDFLKTFVDGFQNCYLIQSANTLGVRETRRLKGNYVLKGLDAIYAKKMDYPVARGSYMIDIHDPTGKGRAIGGEIQGDFYNIPYSSLITDKVRNLIVCGRCISADHVAHSSTRIQGTCMLTGQAAGTAAAVSVKNGVSPCEAQAKPIHDELILDGVYLD